MRPQTSTTSTTTSNTSHHILRQPVPRTTTPTPNINNERCTTRQTKYTKHMCTTTYHPTKKTHLYTNPYKQPTTSNRALHATKFTTHRHALKRGGTNKIYTIYQNQTNHATTHQRNNCKKSHHPNTTLCHNRTHRLNKLHKPRDLNARQRNVTTKYHHARTPKLQQKSRHHICHHTNIKTSHPVTNNATQNEKKLRNPHHHLNNIPTTKPNTTNQSTQQSTRPRYPTTSQPTNHEPRHPKQSANLFGYPRHPSSQLRRHHHNHYSKQHTTSKKKSNDHLHPLTIAEGTTVPTHKTSTSTFNTEPSGFCGGFYGAT